MKSITSSLGIVFFVGIGIGIIVGLSFGPSQQDYDTAISQCDIVRDDYSSALDDAASNIEEANGQLANGQSYAWSSYEDMGETLENLHEVEDAEDPGTTCL